MDVSFEYVDFRLTKLEALNSSEQNNVFTWLTTNSNNLDFDVRSYLWSKASRSIKNTHSFESQKLAYRINTWFINTPQSALYWFNNQPVLTAGGPCNALSILNDDILNPETIIILSKILQLPIPRFGSDSDRSAIYNLFVLAMKNSTCKLQELPDNIYWTYEHLRDDIGEPPPTIKRIVVVAALALMWSIQNAWHDKPFKNRDYTVAVKNWELLLSGMDHDANQISQKLIELSPTTIGDTFKICQSLLSL